LTLVWFWKSAQYFRAHVRELRKRPDFPRRRRRAAHFGCAAVEQPRWQLRRRRLTWWCRWDEVLARPDRSPGDKRGASGAVRRRALQLAPGACKWDPHWSTLRPWLTSRWSFPRPLREPWGKWQSSSRRRFWSRNGDFWSDRISFRHWAYHKPSGRHLWFRASRLRRRRGSFNTSSIRQRVGGSREPVQMRRAVARNPRGFPAE
jgi:hypothetical protein